MTPRRSRTPWLALLVAPLAIVGWGMAWALRGAVHPGDPVGITFGSAALALLTLAMLYGARRRAMARVSRWRLGSARGWLRWHVLGSLLFLLAVMLHAGPGWPAGAMSWSLWLLSLWTVTSGAAGLALQRTLPRVLTERSATEVLYERIPALVIELRERAEALVDHESSPLRPFYERRLAPMLAAPHRDPFVLLGADQGQRRLESIDHLRPLLPDDERSRLEDLEELVQTKLDLDVHYTLQQALRGWLWLHVPPAVVLWLLAAVHVATVLYY